jgi:chromosome segregation ATPase
MNQVTAADSIVPAALRPLNQTKVGHSVPVSVQNLPAALRPIGQVPRQGVLVKKDVISPWISDGQSGSVSVISTSANSSKPIPFQNETEKAQSKKDSDSIAKNNLVEHTLLPPKTIPLSSSSEPASRKFRIPRIDEILSWGKRILEDRSTQDAITPSAIKPSDTEILRHQLDEANRIRTELDHERLQMISRLDSLTQSLAGSDIKVQQQVDSIRQYQKQLSDMQQRTCRLTEQINDAQQRLAFREKEFNELQDLLKDEQQLQEQSQQEIKRLQEKVAWSDKERSLSQEQRESAESTLKQIEEKFRAESDAKDALQAQVNRLQELDAQLQQSRQDHRLAQEQATAAEKEIAEIRLQLEARQQELNWYREELNTTQQLAAQHKKQLDEAVSQQEQTTRLEKEILDWKGEVEKLHAQAAQYQEQLARLQNQILQSETERSTLHAQLNDTLRRLEESCQESARLKEQVQSQIQIQSNLETELAKIRDQKIYWEELCRKRQAQIDQSTDEMTTTRRELIAARQQLDQIRQQELHRQALEEQIQQAEMDDFEFEMTEKLEREDREGVWDIPETLPSERLDKSQGEEMLNQESAIPAFNLAEQILAEQRRIVSSRRQGPSETLRPSDRTSNLRGINHVVQSISPIRSSLASDHRNEVELNDRVRSRPVETLSPIQQEILSEIVAADISLFCRHR